jgi:hypothetical protein
VMDALAGGLDQVPEKLSLIHDRLIAHDLAFCFGATGLAASPTTPSFRNTGSGFFFE